MTTRNGVVPSRRRIVAVFDYTDESGALLFQAVRYEPGFNGEKKTYRQRRPFADAWAWGLSAGHYRQRRDGDWMPIRKEDSPRPTDRRLDEVRRVIYNLPELVKAPSDRPVYVVEGEKDAETLRRLELLATTNAMGAGKWRDEYSDTLRGRHVFIFPDNDDPGRNHAAAVARSLSGAAGSVTFVNLPGLPEKGDVTDWLAIPGNDKAELLRIINAAEPGPSPDGEKGASNEREKQSVERKPRRLLTTPLSMIAPEPVRWLVPGYLPLGKLVLIAGDGGHGKSTLTLSLAAAVSRGRPAFGLEYDAPSPGEALLISCEDDYADTIVPRLLVAGADLQRIHRVDMAEGLDGKPTPFSLAHYEQLANELRVRPEVRLVIIDPAAAYVGRTDVDDHKDSQLRALLGPLAELAAVSRATIELVMHFNKGTAAKAVHKVTGSAAYVNAVRAAFVVAPSAEDDGLKLFLPLKFNLGPKPAGLSYRMEALAEADRAAVLAPFAQLPEEDRARLGEQLVRLAWAGAVDIQADDAIGAARKERDPSKVEKAMAWLEDYLGGCAHPSSEILAAGQLAGFTFDNIKDAKARLKGKGLRHSNKGRFQGEWWSGFGDPETWVIRSVPRSPDSPESPHYGAENDVPPIVGRVGRLGSEGREGCQAPDYDHDANPFVEGHP